jgi:predicted aminopeptidase
MPARLVAILLLSLPLAGCYVLESAIGQLELGARRVPIARLLAAPATPAPLAARLRVALEVREFASRELGLPDNASYRSYADIGRPYVVWNVFATREFSVDPETWCFPVAGCVAYRGYFTEARAHRFALGLEARGDDVAVEGVAAYSTLGHFADPLLSTMLDWDDVELAALVFHELGHQLLYVKNDTVFNESFASVVEDEGVRRWLLAHDRSAELARYEARARRFEELSALVAEARRRLAALYREPLADAARRAAKRAEFARLRAEYAARRERLGHGYDRMFAEGLNNATLVPVATYHDCAPGLARLLGAVGGDLPAFYAAARALARRGRAERHAAVCAGGPAAQ